MSGAKGVQIESVDLPDRMMPGETVTARVDANNTSNFIGPWDDDRCSEGNNYGIRVEGVIVGPNGEEFVGDAVCARQHDIAVTYEATSEVTVTAPESEGTQSFEAFVRTVESGEESGTLREYVDVFADSSDAPDDAPDDDDDDAELPEWIDPSDGGLPVGAAVAVVLVFVAVYAAGNLFDVQIGGS